MHIQHRYKTSRVLSKVNADGAEGVRGARRAPAGNSLVRCTRGERDACTKREVGDAEAGNAEGGDAEAGDACTKREATRDASQRRGPRRCAGLCT